MTTLYLSGPMRGVPYFNGPAFRQAAVILRSVGFDVVSPEEHDRVRLLELGLDVDSTPDEDLPEWYRLGVEEGLDAIGTSTDELMAWDLEQVATCDGMVLLPNWHRSIGARIEARAALDSMHVRPFSFYVVDDGECRRVLARVVANEIATPIVGEPIEVAGPPRAVTATDIVADAVMADMLGPDVVEALTATDEVRVVNATTGGAKGTKLARFDLLPPGPLRTVAEHYGRGASKYEARNWERGYDWSLSFAAMQRHAWQFWNGEDIDQDSGMPHLSAVVFHAFCLMEFARTHPELDDRSKPTPTEETR